ncbi:MAG: phosphate/phosphite/phosphonate ABC transporter substrate-binding protein [Deltaproteobacteria bacterium]|nr:phosphate/phosphite/phosphonate ABC transporter substrate-binding protein [Deltaproteobacteria bacterium]
MSRTSRAVFALLLLGTAAVVVKGFLRPPQPPLRVAFQVCNSIEENRRRFEPLRAYLERKLGRKVVATHVNTFDFAEIAGRGEIDVLQANGYVYINLRSKAPAKPLAREVKADTGKDTGGHIVVRADSPIRSLEDLKGKTMAFGPVLSPGGYLAQYYTMLRAGHDPEKFLGKYLFLPGAWQHEKVVFAVLYGSVDAGAVKFGDIERMEAEGKVGKADFRVIASSEPVPDCVFFALPHVDETTAGRVREALLRLSGQDFVEVEGERINVLKRDGVKGYVPTSDEEFEVLRRMAKETNLPPYEKY